MNRISVVGLGKLGICLATTFAHRGFSVVGVDINPETVSRLNKGQAPLYEPGLDEMVSANHSRLRGTMDYGDAIASSDLTFILVQTPSNEGGDFSLKYVEAAARSLGCALRHKDAFHLVAVQSTVMPGSTELSILPILEEASGKQCGRDFGLCYVPEYVALGTVLRDMLQPSLVVIGEHDEKAGDLLESIYKRYVSNNPPIWRMSIVNAELAKIALNAYITMKISFANTLAEICEGLPSGDVDAVTKAVGSDPRIGSKYFTGGLGFSGPCFPRDTKSFALLSRQAGVEPLQIEATDCQNQTIVPRVLQSVSTALQATGGQIVAILGLSFKPSTVYVRNSPGIELAGAFAKAGYDVIAYDPLATEAAREILGQRVRYAASTKECLQQSDAVVIVNPDPEFRNLGASSFPQKQPPVVVYDCWRLLRAKLETAAHLRYIPLGIGFTDGVHSAGNADFVQQRPSDLLGHAARSSVVVANYPNFAERSDP